MYVSSLNRDFKLFCVYHTESFVPFRPQLLSAHKYFLLFAGNILNGKKKSPLPLSVAYGLPICFTSTLHLSLIYFLLCFSSFRPNCSNLSFFVHWSLNKIIIARQKFEWKTKMFGSIWGEKKRFSVMIQASGYAMQRQALNRGPWHATTHTHTHISPSNGIHQYWMLSPPTLQTN